MKVIISNGFNKFHLSVAASCLADQGILQSFITGSYPTPRVRSLLAAPLLRRSKKLQKLLSRREAVPDQLVNSLGTSELLPSIGIPLQRKLRRPGLANEMNRIGMRQYAHSCLPIVRRAASANIYHYRAGFGHESVVLAKKLGMYALCDHSIAHPELVDFLTSTEGRLPALPQHPPMSAFWRDILADIEQADGVLVNSDFVKKTFEIQGWTGSPVFVTYLGVDQQFMDFVSRNSSRRDRGDGKKMQPLQILFAGGFDQRKGADTVIKSLSEIADIDWTFTIAGTVDADIANKHRSFFSNPRVRQLGWISRSDLAREMSLSDVFLFPSLAEGSARVVFEALASGCYVITTPNSGSIVRDGEHGRVVSAGAVGEITAALREAMADRELVRRIGDRNAALIKQDYCQETYGQRLIALYDKILAKD